jgi:hypothetical protein
VRILVGPLHEFKILPIYTHTLLYSYTIHTIHLRPAGPCATLPTCGCALGWAPGTAPVTTLHTPLLEFRGHGGMRAARSSASFK